MKALLICILMRRKGRGFGSYWPRLTNSVKLLWINLDRECCLCWRSSMREWGSTWRKTIRSDSSSSSVGEIMSLTDWRPSGGSAGINSANYVCNLEANDTLVSWKTASVRLFMWRDEVKLTLSSLSNYGWNMTFLMQKWKSEHE